VRIAYALGIKPSKLAEAQEEIEKKVGRRLDLTPKSPYDVGAS
jgi:hypothetical protein